MPVPSDISSTMPGTVSNQSSNSENTDYSRSDSQIAFSLREGESFAGSISSNLADRASVQGWPGAKIVLPEGRSFAFDETAAFRILATQRAVCFSVQSFAAWKASGPNSDGSFAVVRGTGLLYVPPCTCSYFLPGHFF